MTKQAQVTDYELVDHGVDGSQYFQGCGVALTPYTDRVTGCGDNFRDAYEDALEQLAQWGIDAEDLDTRVKADRTDWVGDGDVPDDAEDMYYYVSIRYSVDVTGEENGNGA